ncbi:hypothetical protein ACOMHN_055780 [Nucella lapillus]
MADLKGILEQEESSDVERQKKLTLREVTSATRVRSRFKKTTEKKKMLKKRMSKFERRYSLLAVSDSLVVEKKWIDYVLVSDIYCFRYSLLAVSDSLVVEKKRIDYVLVHKQLTPIWCHDYYTYLYQVHKQLTPIWCHDYYTYLYQVHKQLTPIWCHDYYTYLYQVHKQLTPIWCHDYYTYLYQVHKQLTPIWCHDYYTYLYQVHKQESTTEEGEPKSSQKHRELDRAKFTKLLLQEGFTVQTSHIGEHIYTKLFCPFKRLCREAERVNFEMPIKDSAKLVASSDTWFSRLIDKYFETDDQDEYISTQFTMNKIDKFEGHENPNTFFRPAVRSFLSHHILINLNIDELDDDLNEPGRREDDDSPQKKKGLAYMLMKENYTDAFVMHEESTRSSIRGDNFLTTSSEDGRDILDKDPRRELDDTWTKPLKFQPLWKIRNYFGERIAFYFAWSGMLCSTLWIPALFGVCVFCYGMYISTTNDVDSGTSTTTNSTSFVDSFKDIFGDFKQSFDNDVTPYFGLVICVWGTIFLEIWKRKNAELAYEWDVEQFEANEPDRPSFSGTKSKKDPITDDWVWYYPFRLQCFKFCLSFSVLVLMISMVLISVVAIIMYRVIMNIDYCPDLPAAECVILTTILSSILNAISILILTRSFFYILILTTILSSILNAIFILILTTILSSILNAIFILILILTTILSSILNAIFILILTTILSSILNAIFILILTTILSSILNAIFILILILTTILSSILNAISILILTSILSSILNAISILILTSILSSILNAISILILTRRFDSVGFLDSGKYQDSCEGSCMTQLSFQVLVLMLVKPFPKFFKDIILVWIRKMWRKYPNCCKCLRKLPCCATTNQVGDSDIEASAESGKNKDRHNRHLHFLKHEHLKPTLGDFTLDEYTEKIIQYGFLMLFATSFPLAPLLALLTNMIDLRVDAKRLLWWYRRPIADVAQDIGKHVTVITEIKLSKQS